MVSSQSRVAPEDVLAPQVRVGSAFVHRCIWLEVLLNVELILFEGQLDVFRVGFSCGDAIKVTTDAILLGIEAIIVSATNRPNVLGHQFAEHASR